MKIGRRAKLKNTHLLIIITKKKSLKLYRIWVHLSKAHEEIGQMHNKLHRKQIFSTYRRHNNKYKTQCTSLIFGQPLLLI